MCGDPTWAADALQAEDDVPRGEAVANPSRLVDGLEAAKEYSSSYSLATDATALFGTGNRETILRDAHPTPSDSNRVK